MMLAADTPRWRGFERLGERIMRDLHPHATVKWNETIQGRISGVPRQIDVSVRWLDGDEERLLIIDAKDWKNPADIGDLEKFAGLVRDVHASRGALVCNKGFTAATLTYAKNLGIELYNLHDAESRDWSRDLTIPIIWVDYIPEIRTDAQIWLDAGEAIVRDENFPFILTEGSGDGDQEVGETFKQVKALSSFAEEWNNGNLPMALGQYHRIRSDKPLSALVANVKGSHVWRPLKDFGLTYVVKRVARLGHFRPTECRGLINYLDNQAFTVSYLPISQVPANPETEWQEIDDPDVVALSIRGTIATSTGMMVLDPHTGTTEDYTLQLINDEDHPSAS
jgi:restriction endonuclease